MWMECNLIQLLTNQQINHHGIRFTTWFVFNPRFDTSQCCLGMYLELGHAYVTSCSAGFSVRLFGTAHCVQLIPISNGVSFSVGIAARGWSWPPLSIDCQSQEFAEFYPHYPRRFNGVMRKYRYRLTFLWRGSWNSSTNTSSRSAKIVVTPRHSVSSLMYRCFPQYFVVIHPRSVK